MNINELHDDSWPDNDWINNLLLLEKQIGHSVYINTETGEFYILNPDDILCGPYNKTQVNKILELAMRFMVSLRQ